MKKQTYTLTQTKHFIPPNLYEIPSTGLLRSWTFTPESLRAPPIIKIGEVLLDAKRLGSDQPYVLDCAQIRSYLQSVLPDGSLSDSEYNKLVALNSFLFGKQIEAISFYPSVDNDTFFQTIFNRDVPIYFLLFPSSSQDVSIPVIEERVERMPTTSKPDPTPLME